MKINKHLMTGILLLSSATLLINSCVDPMYDMAKGINTEISIGGDSLALPIGSTDSILLGDFLSSDDMDFLKTLEDGGYGFSISDSIVIDDLLKDLDVDKLKLKDTLLTQNTTINFENVDINTVIDKITPAVDLDTIIEINFKDYAPDENKLKIQDIEQHTGKDKFLAEVSPFNTFESNINPQFPFTISDPIDIGNLTTTINYLIEVPEGVTNIHQVDLTQGGKLEIELALGGVNEAMTTGTFTPNISINPTDLFKFGPLTPLTDGNIVFGGSGDVLQDFNGYSKVKSLDIIAFQHLPLALNGKIAIEKIVNVTGSITAAGVVRENKISDAKNIDLIINVKIKDLKIKNLNFDIPEIKTTINGSTAFNINNNDVPEEIDKINTVFIGKKAGSPMNTNLVILIKPDNLPDIKSPNFKIENLNITFPSNFVFSSMSGNTYTASNVSFVPSEGYAAEINLTEIGLSHVPINDKTLSWSGDITYNGTISINGVMDSEDINSSNNPVVNLKAQSDMVIESASFMLKYLKADFQDGISFNMDINDIPSEIVSLDSIILKNNSQIEFEVAFSNLPELGDAQLNAEMKIKFPEIFQFTPGTVNQNNELILNEKLVKSSGKQMLSKLVGLRGMKFDGSQVNGKININEMVQYDVKFTVDNPSINTEDLKDIFVEVKVKMNGLEFKSVYGKFNVDLADQMNIPNLTLEDLPDFMKGDDVVLDINNPVLSLVTESNIGIPVDTELSLTKYRDNVAQTNDKISLNFSLPKANSSAETVKTAYWYAPSNAGMPSGYTYVQTNIQNLLKPIPDYVKIDITPVINMGYQHLIDLTSKYRLKVKYDLNVPLKFGKDLSIVLKDTINDVNLDLGEMELNSGAIEISAKIINSIPLNLGLDLVMLDKDFNILATTDTQTILAGSPQGKGVESNIKIKLVDDLGEIKNLNKVILTFRATSNSTVAGTPIRPDNFIKADLKVRILGGLKVKL